MNRDGKYDLEGVFNELLSERNLDKPNFDPDDRWYPSPDDNIVNEYVNDRLNDINI
jgi:hypothetical protein